MLDQHNDLASSVIAPPYDVLSEEEARAIATKNPTSFIRVTRSEVDHLWVRTLIQKKHIMEQRTDSNSFDEGTLVQDDQPCFISTRRRGWDEPNMV